MYNSNDIIKQLIKDRANFLKENQKNIEKKNNDYYLLKERYTNYHKKNIENKNVQGNGINSVIYYLKDMLTLEKNDLESIKKIKAHISQLEKELSRIKNNN